MLKNFIQDFVNKKKSQEGVISSFIMIKTLKVNKNKLDF